MIIYIGPVGEQSFSNFISNYFIDEYEVIEFPPVDELFSRKKFKEMITTKIKGNSKITALLVGLSLDPIFYEKELLDLGKYVKLIGFFSDDGNTSRYSMETAYYFDHILTGDYAQKLKYENIGVSSSLFLPETSLHNFKLKKLKRDIDILLYGSNEKGRSRSINALKLHLNQWTVLDLTEKDQRVPFPKLLEYLNRSKITINWGGVRLDDLIVNYQDPLMIHYKLFKARIVESGLMGCVTLTDFDYSSSKLFSIKFDSDEDLILRINNLLSDDDLLKSYSYEAHNSAVSYVNSIQQPIYIESIKRRDKKLLIKSIVDKTSSTYAFLHSMHNLRNLHLRLFLDDLTSIKWNKLHYRFIIQTKFNNFSLIAKFKKSFK